jgi:hypothetical protein
LKTNGSLSEVGSSHTYEVRPREDHRGLNLISDMLPFGRLLYLEVREAVDYARFYSRSHDAMILIYDERLPISNHWSRFTIPFTAAELGEAPEWDGTSASA